jgi:hypothetical protein
MSIAFRSFLTLLFSSMSMLLWAQDTTISSQRVTTTTSTETTSTDWYTQPWIWIVGGAVVLIILVALLRGGPTRDKEVRTTVIKG